MTVSSLGISALTQLIVRSGPQMAETALKSSSPLMADDSVLEKTDPDGGEWTATCFVPENHAVTILADNDSLPTGCADAPVPARQLPAIHFGLVTMGRAAADAAISSTRATVRLFEDTITNRLSQMTRQIGRALHGNSVSPSGSATWSGTAANSTVTISFTDLSLFKPGAAYHFNDDTASKVYTIRCTDVTYTTGVGGTASFINDVPNVNGGAVVALTDTSVQTADTFALRGHFGAGFGVAAAAATTVGFSAISGTGSLHGVTNSTLPGWNSMSKSAGGALSQELLLQFGAQMVQFSGHQYTHVIMSPNLAAAYMAATNSTSGTVGGFAMANVDSTSDKYKAGYGTGLTVGGKPLIADPNCPSGVALFHNRDFVKLCVWKKLAPDLQDGDKLQSRTSYSYDYQIDARLNMVTNKRSTLGTITGITAFAG